MGMCCSKDIYSEKEDPLDEAGRQGTYRKYGNEQEAPRCLRIRERRQQESLGLRYANPAYNPSRQGSASSMACNLELALADNYMRQNAMPDWSSSSSSGGGGGGRRRRNNMATQRPSPPGSGENTPPLASVSSATISVWSFIQDPQPGTSATAIAKMKEMKEKAVEVLREPNNIQYADDDDEDDEDEIVEIMV